MYNARHIPEPMSDNSKRSVTAIIHDKISVSQTKLQGQVTQCYNNTVTDWSKLPHC